MIVSKETELNGTTYTVTYSDEGYYIERNGEIYCEAVDPIGSGRTYTETTDLIDPEVDKEEATAADYIAALKELGVSVDEEAKA